MKIEVNKTAKVITIINKGNKVGFTKEAKNLARKLENRGYTIYVKI